MINSVCKNLKKKSSDFFSSDDKNTIISSYKQTKEWRKMQKWYKNGKSNECELYQKNIISVITKSEIKNTYIRINNEKNVLEIEKKPFTKENGFEYTEDFDGLIEKNSNKYLFNLKFICDEGGAQTRSLKQVYEFIKSQICLLKKNKENKKIVCQQKKYSIY